jgi:vacuolar-type H+-ATPase subunit E/Vma4
MGLGRAMGIVPFIRKELIERADEMVRLARAISDKKRSEILRKAAKLYREATLSAMAEILEKEAEDWDIWSS